MDFLTTLGMVAAGLIGAVIGASVMYYGGLILDYINERREA